MFKTEILQVDNYLPSQAEVQLLLKSLNTPADLLSQLLQSISLILRLYACSTGTISIVSVQRT